LSFLLACVLLYLFCFVSGAPLNLI
jgi:hypothetical protein